MTVNFKPCKLYGCIDAPPSKSMSHRYFIGAALSGKTCELTGIDYSEDILASLDCLKALGAEVEWDDETKTVISEMGESTVTMQIGNKSITVDGVIKEIDVPAQIVNDRTLLPVRAVSESYGCLVDWDDATKTVIITK